MGFLAGGKAILRRPIVPTIARHARQTRDPHEGAIPHREGILIYQGEDEET
jgi:hypothetical protein